MLPERSKPWKEFVFSLGTQSAIVAVLIALALLQPKGMISGNRYLTRLVNTPAAVNHQSAPPRIIPLEIKSPAISLKVSSIEAIRIPQRNRVIMPRQETPVAPKVELASKVVPLPSVAPVMPKQLVKTNVFSTGSSQRQTTANSPQKVQTGGFGDPNGAAASVNNGKQVTIAQMGAFDLPPGSGSGNGLGGSQGLHGVVASAGFGAGVATGNGSTSIPNTHGTVHQAGFGDADPSVVAPAKTRQPVVAPTSPAEILSKPLPAYTEEARKLHIEGEVLLEVLFESSGKLQVVRVVRGLGHGLDEAAIQAAVQIRFKPALRNGRPEDSHGVLHVMFQLA